MEVTLVSAAGECRMVQTALGPILPDALGHCQMHEHLMVSRGPNTDINPDLLIDREDLSCTELLAYRACGGCSILDAQPGGAGRNAAALRRISQTSGVSVITVTGFHLPAFYSPGCFEESLHEDSLCAHFISELRDGVVDGGVRLPVRAGAVKAAIGADGLTGRTAHHLRAAARAAAACDVPLLLHTEMGRDAVRAAALCRAEGLPARKLLVCHADRQADDYAAHEAIAETGAYLEYDTIGRFKYHDDAAECRLIGHMINMGYADRILLSLDTTAKRLASYGGSIGLTYLLTVFLPALRDSGIPEDTLHTITVNNPRAVFL
jgi:5-phospho-D-xylono-1,4-lactonase